MTAQEIYSNAKAISKQTLSNGIAALNAAQLDLFNSLVRMGDSEAVAYFTVITQEDDNEQYKSMYKAYCI